MLMDIVCYTLTDFSSNCKQELRNSNNHERTSSVKYIRLMFKYLGQESNLTEFCWCKKICGWLRKKPTTSNEELFIECSSGLTAHSLDDTLKLLVKYNNSLLHILKQNKRANMETMTKKCTLDIQVIKQTLTVTKLNKIRKMEICGVEISLCSHILGVTKQLEYHFRDVGYHI
ncbi:hypothetical protein BDC45DRAFT_512885 [Circinella umbellata]|nr:hypothetical protein BDC45DRAFT_512885 [Circinella umbellata]